MIVLRKRPAPTLVFAAHDGPSAAVRLAGSVFPVGAMRGECRWDLTVVE